MFLGLPWYVFALVAAVLIAAITVMEKQELKKEHSLEYVVILSVFSFAVAMFLWPWVKFEVPFNILGLIYAASILGSLALWFIAKALRHLDISVVSPQQMLSVAFALLFAFIFLGEKITGIQGLGILILLAGSLFLTREAMHNTAFAHYAALSHTKKQPGKHALHFYQLLVVAAMIFYGASTVIDKFVLGQVSVVTFIFYISIFLAVNHLIIYGIVHRGYKDLPKGLNRAGWLMIIIAVVALFARLAAAEALALASVSLVTPVKKLSSAISTLIGGKMFKEKGVLIRTVVAIVMIVGVWLVVK